MPILYWWMIMLGCSNETAVENVSVEPVRLEEIIQQMNGAWESQDRETIAESLNNAAPFWGQDSALDTRMSTAALWHGSPVLLTEHQTLRGGRYLDFFHPVVEQVVVRARAGTANWHDLENAIQDCELLDTRPRRGLQAVDFRAITELPHVARILGAERVVLGRPESLADEDVLGVQGDLRCRRDRIVESEGIPDTLPRVLYFASEAGDQQLYISIRADGSDARAFVSDSNDDAVRLLEAGLVWDEVAENREETIIEIFGLGLLRP